MSRVRNFRERMNITQQRLAEASGIALRTLSRIEIDNKLTYRAASKLAKVLNTSAAYLLGETDDSTPSFIRSTEHHTANLSKEDIFIAEQQRKTHSKPATLEDFARTREASRNLELLEDRDLVAAEEMAKAMLETIQRERAIRTAQQDGVAKSA